MFSTTIATHLAIFFTGADVIYNLVLVFAYFSSTIPYPAVLEILEHSYHLAAPSSRRLHAIRPCFPLYQIAEAVEDNSIRWLGSIAPDLRPYPSISKVFQIYYRCLADPNHFYSSVRVRVSILSCPIS